MKKLLTFSFFFFVLLSACKKDSNTTTETTNDPRTIKVRAGGSATYKVTTTLLKKGSTTATTLDTQTLPGDIGYQYTTTQNVGDIIGLVIESETANNNVTYSFSNSDVIVANSGSTISPSTPVKVAYTIATR